MCPTIFVLALWPSIVRLICFSVHVLNYFDVVMCPNHLCRLYIISIGNIAGMFGLRNVNVNDNVEAGVLDTFRWCEYDDDCLNSWWFLSELGESSFSFSFSHGLVRSVITVHYHS